jgi:uncharacterized sporulation protein YeaH/YhbH (DUF444 family)
MQHLQGEIAAAEEKAQSVEVAISSASQASSTLERKAVQIQQNKSQGKSSSKDLTVLLKSMSAHQKAAKLANLRQENTRLKREIGRLDFIIYGKSGRYRMWKNLRP